MKFHHFWPSWKNSFQRPWWQRMFSENVLGCIRKQTRRSCVCNISNMFCIVWQKNAET